MLSKWFWIESTRDGSGLTYCVLIKWQARAASPHPHWTRWLREAVSWRGGEDSNPWVLWGSYLPLPVSTPQALTPLATDFIMMLCVKGRHSRFLKITGEALSSTAGKLIFPPHQLHTSTEELMKLHVWRHLEICKALRNEVPPLQCSPSRCGSTGQCRTIEVNVNWAQWHFNRTHVLFVLASLLTGLPHCPLPCQTSVHILINPLPL